MPQLLEYAPPLFEQALLKMLKVLEKKARKMMNRALNQKKGQIAERIFNNLKSKI